MPATPIAACDATTVTLTDGRVLLSFGGCNYLGLANHPAVIGAVLQATSRYGLSSTASRETTGNAASHELLEAELSQFLGVERALLVPDGYLANVAACQGAAGTVTDAVIDERGHASLRDAAYAAGLPVSRYRHRSAESLRRVLADLRPGSAIVLTDGVFTADGAPAPIDKILDALGPEDFLVVDDCHGLGVAGPEGRGSVAAAGLRDKRIVITSSLAKGLGCAGGVVAGAGGAIARCARSTGYFCTTPIAPAVAEGTRAALSVLRAEPWRVERLAANASRLRTHLHGLGLVDPPAPPCSPVVAFTVGARAEMERVASSLVARGFRAPLIAYPGGPAEAYFRLTVNAEHSPEQIDALARALEACVREVHGSSRTADVATARAAG